MNEERMRVLRLLADGKITAEQANELIKALSEEPPVDATRAYGTEDPTEARTAAQQGARERSDADVFSNLEPEQLVEFKIHGIEPSLIREMRELGLKPEQIIEFQIHGVDADFIQQLRELGFTELEPDQIIEFKIHGVDAGFIHEMRELGFADLTPDKLIELKLHGVDANYVRQMRSQELN